MKITVGSPRVLSVMVDNGVSYVAEMDMSSRSPCVHEFFTVDTPFDTVSESGQVICSEIFRENFETACKNHKISADKVIFTINSGRIISRDIVIPHVSSNKIKSLVINNAADYFPVDITDYKLVYKVNRTFTDQSGKKLGLSVCAVPNDILSSYYDLASFLSLTIENIDYLGNSVFRFVKMFEKTSNSNDVENANKVKVYLTMDSSSTIMTFVRNGEAKLQRYVGIGYGGILEYAVKISKKTAEELLSSSDEPLDIYNPPADEPIFGITYDKDEWVAKNRAALSGLCQSISRSMDYFETLFDDFEPEYSLCLMGPSTRIKGLREFIEAGIGTALSEPDLLFSKKSVKAKNIDDFEPNEYAMCVGALIAPLGLCDKRAAKSVPFLVVFKDSAVQNLLLLIGISVFAICVAVSVCLWYLPMAKNHSLNEKVDGLKDKMQELSGVQSTKKEFEKWSDIKETVSGINQHLYTHNDKLVYFIEEFERKMPESFVTKSISITENGVSMTITVDSRYEAMYVIMTLREMKSVKVTSMSNSFTFGQAGSNNKDDDFTIITDEEYALIESKIEGIDWVAFDFTTLDPKLFELFGIDLDDYIDKDGNLIHKNIAPEYQYFSDDEIRVGLNDKTINFFDLFMIKKKSDVDGGASTGNTASPKSVTIAVSLEYTGEFEIPETEENTGGAK